MATHYFNISTANEGGFKSIAATPSSSTGSRLLITAGDSIVFTYASSLSGPSFNLSIGGFSSGFTNSSVVYLATVGHTATKIVKTTDSWPIHLDIYVSGSGAANRYYYISLISSEDKVPDQFSLGPNINGANPGKTYMSSSFVVSGINAPTKFNVYGGGAAKPDNGYWNSSGTVTNGQTIVVRGTAATSYNTTKTITLNIGGVSSSFNIRTSADVSSGEIIHSGITSPVKLSDVLRFYGGDFNFPGNLSHYLRSPGGIYVPNISANSNIPTSLPLHLSKFVGCATSLYFSTIPDNKSETKVTTSSAQTINLFWSAMTDFLVGYGPIVRESAEYRFEMTYVPAWNSNLVPTLTSSSGNPGAWSINNDDFTVSATAPHLSEAVLNGEVTIYARHKNYPSIVISTKVAFNLSFYGP